MCNMFFLNKQKGSDEKVNEYLPIVPSLNVIMKLKTIHMSALTTYAKV